MNVLLSTGCLALCNGLNKYECECWRPKASDDAHSLFGMDLR